jgi:ribose 5-phosphate isomerase A
MSPKEKAGRRAAEFVEDGMVVGLGTGSTAEFTIKALGERVAQGLNIRAIPTSNASAALAASLGIELVTLADCPAIDLTIDGADEVDPQLDLIKGLGGALLREKVVATASRRQIIIIDPSKKVDRLGTKAPLPVEVIPFALSFVQHQLASEGLSAVPRLQHNATDLFITDNSNHILDCHFPHGIDQAGLLEPRLNNIPGVVENGLFIGLAQAVIIGMESGDTKIIERSKP